MAPATGHMTSMLLLSSDWLLSLQSSLGSHWLDLYTTQHYYVLSSALSPHVTFSELLLDLLKKSGHLTSWLLPHLNWLLPLDLYLGFPEMDLHQIQYF